MSSTTGDIRLPVNIVRGTHGQLVAFLVFNIWPSHFGIPLLLSIVLFSKNVKRHPTFINLCVAFIIIGISSTLLLYAGRITGPEPSKILCLLQASLLYGMPPLASTAAFVLVLQMFLMIRTSFLEGEYLDRDHTLRVWAMLTSPYIAFFISVLATAIIGSQRPSYVSRNRRFFYCSLESAPLTSAITIYAAILLFATLVTIVATIRIIYYRLKATRSQGSRIQRTIDLSLPLRIITFGIYITVAMSLSLLSISTPSSPVPDLVIASAATIMLLIFGSQRDILFALFPWVLKKKPPRPISKDYHVYFQQAHELHVSDVSMKLDED